jgi:hypothetical protein
MRAGILFPLPAPDTTAGPEVLLNLPFKRAVLHGGRHCPVGFVGYLCEVNVQGAVCLVDDRSVLFVVYPVVLCSRGGSPGRFLPGR